MTTPRKPDAYRTDEGGIITVYHDAQHALAKRYGWTPLWLTDQPPLTHLDTAAFTAEVDRVIALMEAGGDDSAGRTLHRLMARITYRERMYWKRRAEKGTIR